MYLHEQEKETNRSAIRREVKKIWITAIFVTLALVYLEAIAGQWLVGLIGVKINIGQAIMIAVIANFVVGVINGLKLYAKKENKKREQDQA